MKIEDGKIVRDELDFFEGRRVKKIWFTSSEGDVSRSPKGEEVMGIHMQDLGDHGLDWVIVYTKQGPDRFEIERHNTAFIASIVWDEPEAKP